MTHTLGIFYDLRGRCKSWIGHDMNGARDKRRECKGQVDHLSQMLEDMANINFVLIRKRQLLFRLPAART